MNKLKIAGFALRAVPTVELLKELYDRRVSQDEIKGRFIEFSEMESHKAEAFEQELRDYFSADDDSDDVVPERPF